MSNIEEVRGEIRKAHEELSGGGTPDAGSAAESMQRLRHAEVTGVASLQERVQQGSRNVIQYIADLTGIIDVVTGLRMARPHVDEASRLLTGVSYGSDNEHLLIAAGSALILSVHTEEATGLGMPLADTAEQLQDLLRQARVLAAAVAVAAPAFMAKANEVYAEYNTTASHTAAALDAINGL